MIGSPRVLVTRAGSGASNNLIRSLRAGDPKIVIHGCHDDPFYLRNSSADRSYLVPAVQSARYAPALGRLARAERLHLIIPTTDAEVRALSRHRARCERSVFLPRHETIEHCQDKYRLARTLRNRGVPCPDTRAVTSLASLNRIFRQLRARPLLWCRARRGTGSLGALPVKTVRQARAWIQYWTVMRRVPARQFTISEYLPGRDFACQSLWYGGRLVLIKTTERLSYFQGAITPGGVSSIGAVHKTIRDDRVAEVATEAVRAVDPRAHGAFSIDLKCDQYGEPCVTEINVGRLLTGTPIFDLTGRHNMALTYVRLAIGDVPRIDDTYDAVEGSYMARDLDALPGIFSADDVIAGLFDTSETAARTRAVERRSAHGCPTPAPRIRVVQRLRGHPTSRIEEVRQRP